MLCVLVLSVLAHPASVASNSPRSGNAALFNMYASLRVTALTVTATSLSISVLLTSPRPPRLCVSVRTTDESPNSKHRPAHAVAAGTLLDAEPNTNGTLGGRSLAARRGKAPKRWRVLEDQHSYNADV